MRWPFPLQLGLPLQAARFTTRKTSDRRSSPGMSRFCRPGRTTLTTVKVSHRGQLTWETEQAARSLMLLACCKLFRGARNCGASSRQICATVTFTVKKRVYLNRSSDTAGKVCATGVAYLTGQTEQPETTFNGGRLTIRHVPASRQLCLTQLSSAHLCTAVTAMRVVRPPRQRAGCAPRWHQSATSAG